MLTGVKNGGAVLWVMSDLIQVVLSTPRVSVWAGREAINRSLKFLLLSEVKRYFLVPTRTHKLKYQAPRMLQKRSLPSYLNKELQAFLGCFSRFWRLKTTENTSSLISYRPEKQPHSHWNFLWRCLLALNFSVLLFPPPPRTHVSQPGFELLILVLSRSTFPVVGLQNCDTMPSFCRAWDQTQSFRHAIKHFTNRAISPSPCH